MRKMRIGVASMLSAIMSSGTGCSWLYIKKAPQPVAEPNQPVDCTSSRAAPVADTLYAATFASAGVASFYGASKCSGGRCYYYELGAVASSIAVTLAVSAAMGFQQASRCDDVKALNALCISGEEASCRKLNGTWVPPSTWTPRVPSHASLLPQATDEAKGPVSH